MMHHKYTYWVSSIFENQYGRRLSGKGEGKNRTSSSIIIETVRAWRHKYNILLLDETLQKLYSDWSSPDKVSPLPFFFSASLPFYDSGFLHQSSSCQRT